MPARKTTTTRKTTRKSKTTKTDKVEVANSQVEVVSITKRARNNTSSSALNDRASDAREHSTQKWDSGLGKYARWRKEFRYCSLEQFKQSPPGSIEGKVSPNDKHGIGLRTGRIWV